MIGRVLVADDKPNILKLMRDVLGERFDVTVTEDGNRALALLLAGDFDVIVSDIRMPGADGMTVLREVRRARPDVEVILMTAHSSVAGAVEAMKQGAYDYLAKPFDPDEALLVVERAVERKRLREQARDLRSALEGAARFENIVGTSGAMQHLFGLLRRAAAAEITVLVTGESGTGKDLVARAIHLASSRAQKRFVPVHCAAIPESLMEAELFGHTKGAFTGAVADRRGLFEEADGGTLFLDEVGDLPYALQVKLTRVLQERAVRKVGGSEERPVDVRVIAATNVDLKQAVREGRFRKDLFYRLNVYPITVPPVRDRREDIPALAALFLDRYGSARDPHPDGFTPEALATLCRYSWPGNVRELENAVERAVAVRDGPRITVADLPEEVIAEAAGGDHGVAAVADSSGHSYREVVDLARDRASREYLVTLMRFFEGNVTRAAERAGMERESLHRLLKRHSLRSEDFKGKGSEEAKR